MINYGFIESKLDGSENIMDNENEYSTLDIPKEYSYINYMPPVLDQGSQPSCVPHSISAVIDWKNSINGVTDKFSKSWLFNQRENENGMSFKESLKIMKNNGFEYENGKKGKIDYYGKILSFLIMQRSLIINGPFVLALPVYDMERKDFWNGSDFKGGHAVCCVGYNKDGLIIRNSWGDSWGDNGHTLLPYNEINRMYEAWALI